MKLEAQRAWLTKKNEKEKQTPRGEPCGDLFASVSTDPLSPCGRRSFRFLSCALPPTAAHGPLVLVRGRGEEGVVLLGALGWQQHEEKKTTACTIVFSFLSFAVCRAICLPWGQSAHALVPSSFCCCPFSLPCTLLLNCFFFSYTSRQICNSSKTAASFIIVISAARLCPCNIDPTRPSPPLQEYEKRQPVKKEGKKKKRTTLFFFSLSRRTPDPSPPSLS